MAHAIRLYFDRDLDTRLAGVRRALVGIGVSPALEALDDRPHVSVAGGQTLDASACKAMLRELAAATPPFPAHFAAFGSFPGANGVVYLAPTPSEALLAIHRAVHGRLAAAGVALHPHFRPQGWIPHVTVAFELPEPQVALALSWLHTGLAPLAGSFAEIGLVEYYPIREVATFALGR